MMRSLLLFLIICALSACAPQPPTPSPGHLQLPQMPAPEQAADIPAPVQQAAYLPPPSEPLYNETYSVVVAQIDVTDLLFVLARDAKLNVDIHPGITGVVTLNAIDQTLPQILDRLSQQLGLRYELKGNNLSVRPDTPYVHTYQIDYVNMKRKLETEISISTEIETSISIDTENSGSSSNTGNGTDTNRSLVKLNTESEHDFWTSLVESLGLMLGAENAQATAQLVNANVESGLISVRATRLQHQQVQSFFDRLTRNVQRQVLIEATIAEVTLSNQYQAGIDWKRIANAFTYEQSMLTTNLGGTATDGTATPYYLLQYSNPTSAIGNISATLRMLEQFGNVKVLSSPRLLVINNQTAILKVVDNEVYFTVKVETRDATDNTQARETIETQVHTVPVGLIMSVTPQISESDNVLLNVRPTILRILGYKTDPNPYLSSSGVTNQIPITQVREIESILRVQSGEIAVIGGLMEDKSERGTDGIPGLASLPRVGDLFSYRNDQYTKTELVIFLRPLVVENPSLDGDLREYRRYLPNPAQPDSNGETGLPFDPQAVPNPL